MRLVIGYDGSADAKAAVDRAGALCPGGAATVLTVWEPFATLLARTPVALGSLAGIGALPDIDREGAKAAAARAREGAARARAAGLDATPVTVSRRASISAAILDEADRVGAEAIVVGSRGLTGIGSLLLGSVSHGVLQHADRTVVVVPGEEVAARRRRRRENG